MCRSENCFDISQQRWCLHSPVKTSLAASSRPNASPLCLLWNSGNCHASTSPAMLGVHRGHFWCTCPCCAGNRSWWDQHGWRQMGKAPDHSCGSLPMQMILWFVTLLPPRAVHSCSTDMKHQPCPLTTLCLTGQPWGCGNSRFSARGVPFAGTFPTVLTTEQTCHMHTGPLNLVFLILISRPQTTEL